MENKIELIKWSDRYKIGYKRIDDQHKELVHIINDLYNISKSDDLNSEETKKSLSSILRRAIDYATYHFSYEEKIMEAINYNDSKEHIAKHREFSIKVLDEINMYESENSILVEDFINFLKDWLLNHIVVEDKKFIAEVKSVLTKMCENDL